MRGQQAQNMRRRPLSQMNILEMEAEIDKIWALQRRRLGERTLLDLFESEESPSVKVSLAAQICRIAKL